MASQVVPAAKRLRMSLLLDTYGELLTNKQRTFIHLYYEEDYSFGEIAREFDVSRQAIFDSVRHGEEALEHFERVLRLVESGWARLLDEKLTPETLARRLASVRKRIDEQAEFEAKPRVLDELDRIIGQLSVPAEPETDQ